MIEEAVIVKAPRGTEFRNYIRELLSHCIKDIELIDELTAVKDLKSFKKDLHGRPIYTGIKVFEKAFTSAEADPDFNYELLEFLGDGKIKAFLVDYVHELFPEIDESDSLPAILTKAKTKYEAKTVLSEMGLNLGMKRFITATEHELSNSQKSSVEDVFEAFLGAISVQVKKKYPSLPIDQAIIDKFLRYSYSTKLNTKIEIDYQKLTDSVSQLKEHYDRKRSREGIDIRYIIKDHKVVKIGSEHINIDHLALSKTTKTVMFKGKKREVYTWKEGEIREIKLNEEVEDVKIAGVEIPSIQLENVFEEFVGKRDMKKIVDKEQGDKKIKYKISGTRDGKPVSSEFDTASIHILEDVFEVLAKAEYYTVQGVKQRLATKAIEYLKKRGETFQNKFL